MGALAPALPFISLGFNVLGGIQERNAMQAQAAAQIQQQQAQAAAARYNQQIAEQNAKTVEQQTQAEVEIQDKQRRLRAGAAAAAAGASGIGAESFGDIFLSNAAQEELDLLTIKSEGALKAQDYRQQGQLYGMSAQSSLAQVPYIKSAASASKAASVLSSFGKGVQTYASMKGL